MSDFKNYTNAPKTRLNSIKILKKEENNWQEYIKNMSRALEEMRVNYDRAMPLKNIENVSNPLLKRRLEKNGGGGGVLSHQNPNAFHSVKRRQLEDGKVRAVGNNGGGENSENANSNKTAATVKKPSPTMKRVLSEPVSRTPLTAAFYYTSNLKNQIALDDADEKFLNASYR